MVLGQDRRDRIKSGIAVAAFHALLGYAFVTGLGFDVTRSVGSELKLFDVADEVPPQPATPAPPEPARSEQAKPKDSEGAASPANLRDTPSPVVAPPPEVRIEVPSPVIAAPVAGAGNAASAGAAEVPGPGTGSGGEGNGLGSGAYGDGTGGGGHGGGIGARLIRGGIRGSDYPQAVGTVGLRFVVTPKGRVRDCRVTRSSGNRDLDSTTCRLIERRFRYRPARDWAGNPIAQVVRGEHVWEVGPEPPPVEVIADIPE